MMGFDIVRGIVCRLLDLPVRVVEERPVMRFVGKINTKVLVSYLKSPEMKFFFDECEREARYTDGKTDRERVARSHFYSGVRFVADKAGEWAKVIKQKEEPAGSRLRLSDTFGLSDQSLLATHRRSVDGQGNQGETERGPIPITDQDE